MHRIRAAALLWLAALLAAAGAPAAEREATAPVRVEVCGVPTDYPQAPRRAVTHDVNITEMFLALGLADRLVGYGGVRADKWLPPGVGEQLAGVPRLSAHAMNLETILGVQADFVFAGWGYGFRDGQVTPARLAEFGIASYVLTESCVRKVARQRVALEDTFTDLLNLGRIFRIEARAQALVDRQRRELQAITDALGGDITRPKVFLYDSGRDVPVTAGRYAMPHALIEAAGGSNLFADLDGSWVRGNWEDVIARDPDWIVVVDYDQPNAQGKQDFLLAKPELAHLAAIRQRRFVVLDYAQATPGPRNVAAVRKLAHALHPDRVPAPAASP